MAGRPVKFVVTGGCGHIGSRLIRELPARFPGAEIVIIDDMMTQRFPSLFDLPASGRYHTIEADITRIDFAPVLAGADVVIHLAAITDAATSAEKRDLVEKINFGGTRRVGEACARANVPLIALSSTSVYGTQKSVVDEDCSEEDLKPQSPYADSKLREERVLAELGATHGLRFFIARFGTIFGVSPGMRFHTAVNRFCWQAAMGQKLAVWRTAIDQKRPYLDLADAVEALALVVERRLFDNRIYNVLTLNATVRQIIETIGKHVPKLEFELVDSAIMNQLSYEIDDRRFRSIGFAPKGDLDRGVRETVHLLARAAGRN
jgi:nucleoside-diphosphate-sugar epimerase